MVPVASLLNPVPPSCEHYRKLPRSISRKAPLECSQPLVPLKKQKVSKAAATFVKGKPNGDVNYPPYEIQDEETAAEHERFEVRPIGRIEEYPKRIPYNSEKKTFQQKTGMDGFEVYQYTFRMPDDDRSKDPHTVMWDYNVGLVRFTSFFKSLKHSKTMPAKVMNANPGLKDISHSITGGSISAQGYWVPYDAAKAVAARFCYEIRHVLVPVFGPDFVSMCRNYADRSYLHLKVDRSIIERCTDAAKVNQAHSREASVAVSPRPPASFVSLSMCRASKSLRSKLKAVDVESGYGTDSDRSEKYPGSPSSLGYNGWTPVNSPRLETYRFLPPNSVTSTPRTSDPPATLQSGTRSCAKRVLSDIDRASEEESWSETSSAAAAALAKRRKISAVISPEIGAAYTLIQMNMADATLGERKEAKRRRASA